MFALSYASVFPKAVIRGSLEDASAATVTSREFIVDHSRGTDAFIDDVG